MPQSSVSDNQNSLPLSPFTFKPFPSLANCQINCLSISCISYEKFLHTRQGIFWSCFQRPRQHPGSSARHSCRILSLTVSKEADLWPSAAKKTKHTFPRSSMNVNLAAAGGGIILFFTSLLLSSPWLR